MDGTNETLQYYHQHAETFISRTFSADMTSVQARFLAHLPALALILDLGCGSGRDALSFLQQGFMVDAVDGSAKMCRAAAQRTGLPVRQMLFQELDAKELYDGIWACASILHLDKKELATVLNKIAVALKPGGVFYTSFKYGSFEGMRGGRYFTDFTEETLGIFWDSVFGNGNRFDANSVNAVANIATVDSSTTGASTSPVMRLFETWVTADVRPDKEERWINLLARRV